MVDLCYMELIDLIKSVEFNMNKLKAIANVLIETIEEQEKPKGYSGSTSYTDYDAIHGSREEFHADTYRKLSDELSKLSFLIETYEGMLDNYVVVKEEIEETYSKLSGLECKVYFMRVMQGKSIKEIADTLNYNYTYISDISCRVRNLSVTTTKTNIV